MSCADRCAAGSGNAVPGGSREIASASYEEPQRNQDMTEFVEIPGRGPALAIDSGWREVADTAFGFIQRFVK